MKTNNKGYSLVELVMTLGCFSIIMLAIMLMMRTTIATYKDGLLEARKQQEAQIVANQVADLIVDAKAYGGGYNFTTAEGDNKVFVLDATTKTLYFDVPGAISSGFGTPLSDCVTDFEIEGLKSAALEKAGGATDAEIKLREYDNTCRVKISIDYMGREYEAVKDVHFRNEIENPTQYDVSQDDSAAPSPTPSGEKEIVVLRYETIDLTKKYGITSIVSQTNMAGWYDVDDTVVSKSSHGITVKCNATINGNLNAPNNKTSNCKIVGKDADGHETTFWFYTEPFSFDVGTKPVFIDYYESITNNGYHQDMPIKGVHINEMLRAGKSIKYRVEFKSNGVTKKLSDEITLSVNNGGDNGQASSELQFDGMRLKLGLVPNAFSNDLIISTGNEAHNQDATGKQYRTNDGKQELIFHIYFPGETSPRTVTYKYYMAGATLEHAGD
ncbi:MAG: type II secretion system protein [Lachnospiraceae bacterium]|nr:type II secretion system protein [Lachnospiraceae bacterium]